MYLYINGLCEDGPFEPFVYIYIYIYIYFDLSINIICDSLPRQARDKRRGNSKSRPFSLPGLLWRERAAARAGQRTVFPPFPLSSIFEFNTDEMVYQDRLETNMVLQTPCLKEGSLSLKHCFCSQVSGDLGSLSCQGDAYTGLPQCTAGPQVGRKTAGCSCDAILHPDMLC